MITLEMILENTCFGQQVEVMADYKTEPVIIGEVLDIIQRNDEFKKYAKRTIHCIGVKNGKLVIEVGY